MRPKYQLAISELYFIPKHGHVCNDMLNYIMTHYIVNELVYREEFFNNTYKESIEIFTNYYRDNVSWIENNLRGRRNASKRFLNPYIKNIYAIISRFDYVKLDIIEVVYSDESDGNYMLAIVKTFWLKILQRTWRKKYQKRKKIINHYKNPRNLFRRQLGLNVQLK